MSIREIEPPETRLAFRAMLALRPDLRDEETFVRLIDEVQRAEGYRLVGVFVPEREEAVAVAGFRIGNNLAWGRYLFVDDLSTLPDARRAGHARSLLDWLMAEARRRECDEVHLESGVGPQRADAHRLYLVNGFRISSHHFMRPAGD